MTSKDVVISLKPLDHSKATREDVLAYFNNTWDLYETIFRGFTTEDALYVIPDKLRRPLIFYLGHTVLILRASNSRRSFTLINYGWLILFPRELMNTLKSFLQLGLILIDRKNLTTIPTGQKINFPPFLKFGPTVNWCIKRWLMSF